MEVKMTRRVRGQEESQENERKTQKHMDLDRGRKTEIECEIDMRDRGKRDL